MTINRRRFISGLGTCGLTASLLNTLNLSSAYAQSGSEYRALVCVFFLGGLDNNDTVFPTQQSEYDQLADVRQGLFSEYGGAGSSSTRARSNLLPLDQINDTGTASLGGRTYGLPEQLRPIHELFDQEEMAIVGSLGPLVDPNTNRQTFDDQSVELPPRLFSHNDQQNYWQGLGVEGETIGWGGKLLDALIAAGEPIDPRFAAIITSGTSLLLNGNSAKPFRITSNGPLNLDFNNDALGGGSARNLVESYLARNSFGSSSLFNQDLTRLQSEAIGLVEATQSAFQSTSIVTDFPSGSLSSQLQGVARSIQARNSLGVNRQIFFVATGGFDTHNNQATKLPGLQSDFSTGIRAFRDEMVAQGDWDKVTLFTASDFGRSAIENGRGTDHGWASHHFVAGGSIRGKRIFGALPSTDFSSAEYTPTRGRLIPKVSIEQYGATMGGWLGVSDNAVSSTFPNLANFSNRTMDIFE